MKFFLVFILIIININCSFLYSDHNISETDGNFDVTDVINDMIDIKNDAIDIENDAIDIKNDVINDVIDIENDISTDESADNSNFDEIQQCIDNDGDNYGDGNLCKNTDCDDTSRYCNIDCVTDRNANNTRDCDECICDLLNTSCGSTISTSYVSCETCPSESPALSTIADLPETTYCLNNTNINMQANNLDGLCSWGVIADLVINNNISVNKDQNSIHFWVKYTSNICMAEVWLFSNNMGNSKCSINIYDEALKDTWNEYNIALNDSRWSCTEGFNWTNITSINLRIRGLEGNNEITLSDLYFY